MCASACYWAQMGTVVYGASDEKMGAESKKLSLFHPKTVIRKGVSADISAQLMKLFFKNKR
jgi:tRNA(adenine34) deaminase